MKSFKLIACLIGAIIIAPILQLQSFGATQTNQPSPNPVFFDQSFDASKPAAAYDLLVQRQQQRRLAYSDTMDLAMTFLLQTNWQRAAGIYQSAAAATERPAEKAAALAGAAQSLAAARQWGEAANLANQTQQLAPNSREAAALRYVFWKKSGDELESRVADDGMKQLDLSMDGNPVMEPITGLVIVVVVAVLPPIIALAVRIYQLPDDAIVRLAEQVFENDYKMGKAAIDAIPFVFPLMERR